MKNIIVITGPTGVGKTKLSIELARKIDAEIINADSMQIYRQLNIGTAKIKEEEKEGIIHHLIDIKDINEDYSIYDYQKDCRNEIAEITKRGKKVIIVGGSGLYIRAALYDYNLEEEPCKKEYNDKSNAELYNMVKEIDKDTTIHINNRRRLIRFLNRIESGNISSKKASPIYDFTIIGLTTKRDCLYELINRRVDLMFDNGLLNEVRSIYEQGIRSKAVNTAIGYKELYEYFDKKITLEEAISEIKKNSRHYAKRQYTFFNHQFDITWFNVDYNNFENTICDVYEYLER